MSNIECFQELLAKNDEAKAKVEKWLDGKGDSPAELVAGIIAIAKEYGIRLSEEDVKVGDEELSEAELADVSAGRFLTVTRYRSGNTFKGRVD